jgi:hypothetical protein
MRAGGVAVLGVAAVVIGYHLGQHLEQGPRTHCQRCAHSLHLGHINRSKSGLTNLCLDTITDGSFCHECYRLRQQSIAR